MDPNGVVATYGTGAFRQDYNKNFRSDGKRFDFSINSSAYASCELYGYFAAGDVPDDEVSGKMGGGKHSGSNAVKCYDMGIGCRDGNTRYRTENPHPNYQDGASGGKGTPMSSRYIGYKFVKRNISGAVLLEILQDTGDNEGAKPANQWKKVASWRVTSPLWQTPGSDHQETIRIDGSGGVPSLKYKWIGLREILTNDVEGGVVGGGTTTTPGTTPPVIDQGVDLGTISFVGLDLNNDGVVEGYDGNRDGKADGFDTNNDGIIDAIDVYGTGRANAFDTDGDGITDAYDTNGDGVIDKRGGGPGLNTSGPGGVNSPDSSGNVPSVVYTTRKLPIFWAIDSINVDACSVNSPVGTADYIELFNAPADNIYADTLNYRKIGIAVNTAQSIFVGKRIRKLQCTVKRFGIGTISGLLYCRIRSSNGTIVEEFQNTIDSSGLDNNDANITFTHAAPQHAIENGDLIYVEFPEGGDPANYVRVKITNSEKSDSTNSILATDDNANTIKNINKDPAFIVWQ